VCHGVGIRYHSLDPPVYIIFDGGYFYLDPVSDMDMFHHPLGDGDIDLEILHIDHHNRQHTRHNHIADFDILLDDDPIGRRLHLEIVVDGRKLFCFERFAIAFFIARMATASMLTHPCTHVILVLTGIHTKIICNLIVRNNA